MLDIDALRKKFPLIHGRDFGEKLTLGDIVARVGQALDANASKASRHDVACDILDRDLLFGAWGNRWGVQDWELLRQLRGAIIAAYELGKTRAVGK
jgi:hypothetical protein